MGYFNKNEQEVLNAKKNYISAIITFVNNNIGTDRKDVIEFRNEILRVGEKNGYTIVGVKNTENGVLFLERRPDGVSIEYNFVKNENLTLREVMEIGKALELWYLIKDI